MADHDHNTNNFHTARDTHTHTREKSSGGSMAFIVGGLVVAVAVIGWLFFAGGDDVGTTAAVDGENTTVNVEAPEATASSDAEMGAVEGIEPTSSAGAEAEAGAETGGDIVTDEPAADAPADAPAAEAGAEAEATTGN